MVVYLLQTVLWHSRQQRDTLPGRTTGLGHHRLKKQSHPCPFAEVYLTVSVHVDAHMEVCVVIKLG
ncbi:hypothetical protein SCLCIDRAFT_479657 [Scleroderma citrinum Foug A]|uniref:Uncharacterized protein n=1 Tax=Scleroderma citrinum Foug A TaxID=1036808 RepID=A0A0C2YTD4_9AGAM|nr:hypothetical protein SCLCIDRAFT_479657 [Scleroderma citrinum Foug A]